jgi:4,5-dihydroxyphthalate decarboxylase
MGKLPLTLALAHYDRHVPFFDGSVAPEGVDLSVLQVGQSAPLRHGKNRHQRMLKEGEFDACEVSLSSYLMARARNWPFTAVPVFPRRLFSQSQIWVNLRARLGAPQDLVGRKVGLSTFQTTCSVLAKGDLEAEYGVPWRKIRWVCNREETVSFAAGEGVVIERVPEGQKIGAMLETGEIDALIMPHPPSQVVRGSPEIGRLFADPRQEETRYFRKNGFFPIMHVLVFRNEVLREHPWVGRAVAEAFEEARRICEEFYAADPNWSVLVWGRHAYEEQRRLLGADPWRNGFASNRANLERFIGYSLEQGLLPRKLLPEELFQDATLDT